MLNAAARQLIAQFPLGFVATVDAEGRPRVSPKGTFLVVDEATVGFGDIRSPGTAANLAHRPECEVNFIDPFLRKGLRLRGSVRLLGRGTPDFDALIGEWQAVWPGLADRITQLVLIDLAEVKPLSTPAYDDGTSEAEMLALYQAKFAGIHP